MSEPAVRYQEQIGHCWTEVGNLAHALESRTRFGYIAGLMRDDDRLADLETKAIALAQALNEIRVLRRLG